MTSKTLSIYASGIQRHTTVLLMFKPPNSSNLYRDQFPVAWKTITFRAGGHAKATVEYVPRLAFGCPQIVGQ
ncbi:hypothetical protein FRC07_000575 [Ceratobasidium sp. 392]|nr:hypothetical protein FRC07_000575 [Ceratobasidium sp. 392]